MDRGKESNQEEQIGPVEFAFNRSIQRLEAELKKREETIAPILKLVEQHPTDAVYQLLGLMVKEALIRLGDDISVLKTSGLLASVLDLTIDKIRQLQPSVSLALEHDKVYRELQEMLKKRAEKQKETGALDKEQGFDLMLKRMVERGVVG